ncbi:MAG: phosphatase PAP2 family protein [Paludibacteraceae bacterium]|nr:phosphatase PAP2 family protein [Paludibacteraceae bacterium]
MLKNKAIPAYLTLCAILWIGLCVCMLVFDKSSLHLALQLPHGKAADFFFRYYSLGAEIWLYPLMALPLCFRRWRDTIVFAVAEGLSAAIVQTVKHLCNMPRPVTWFTEQFGNADALTLAEGVKMNLWHSFPSGHTATFFAFFTVCVWLWASHNEQTCTDRQAKTTNRQWQDITFATACFAMAAIGGYSRIYLSQHFAADVLGGSIIGTTAALLVCYVNEIIKRKNK